MGSRGLVGSEMCIRDRPLIAITFEDTLITDFISVEEGIVINGLTK